MVGGGVIGVRVREDRVWVEVGDLPHPHTRVEVCGLYVERNPDSEQIKIGDSLWWQGRFALWTEAGRRTARRGDSPYRVQRSA